MSRVKLIAGLVLCVAFVVCLPVYSFAYTGPDVVRTAVYGVAVGGSSSASWLDASYNMTDSNNFAVKCSADTVGTRLRLRIYVDTDSITQFHLRINTGTAGPQVSQALQQSATWSYIYSYNHGTDSFTGGASISDKCTLTQTANPSVWDFYYVGDTAISGNCIQVTLFTASHNYTANTWFHFNIEHFTVNGQDAAALGPTEYNEGFADVISDLAANEDEWWQLVVVPGYDDYIDNTEINNALADYKLVIKEVSFNNFLVPSLIIIVFTFAFYGFVLFGKKG